MPPQPRRLLNRTELERSDIVANNRMNRERNLHGINSYQKELGFDFLDWLRARPGEVHWMDLCCGRGNALIQAAKELNSASNHQNTPTNHPNTASNHSNTASNHSNTASNHPNIAADAHRFHLEGLDLVGMFTPIPDGLTLQLQIGSVADWQPTTRYDLITCIHGIHYIGDKIGTIRNCLNHLKDDGLLAINLDPENLKGEDGKPLKSWWKAAISQKAWEYHPRRHLLLIHGHQDWNPNLIYRGADDKAGPNYSQQPVVDSYYA